MKKKLYVKPEMEVYMIDTRTPLLAGSDPELPLTDEWPEGLPLPW